MEDVADISSIGWMHMLTHPSDKFGFRYGVSQQDYIRCTRVQMQEHSSCSEFAHAMIAKNIR